MGDILIQKAHPDKPLSLVIMCCDDPNHFHLIEQVARHAAIRGIVIESNDAQMQRLYQRKKYKLWAYRRYHSRRRKIMGHSQIRKDFFPSQPILEEVTSQVLYADHINAPEVVDFLQDLQPDLTICAGTMFIGKKVRLASNNLINLHGGILPEYKGNQCIFFALHEHRPDKVGATLHLVNGQLDGGPIIDWVKPEIQESDNDEQLYCKAFQQSVVKLVELVREFDKGSTIPAFKQKKSTRKTFSHTDRTPWVEFKHWFSRQTNRSG